MMPRHYAPRTPLECVEAGKESERLALLLAENRRVGWVVFADPGVIPSGVMLHVLPSDPAGYAAQLYAVLHELDAAGLDRILVTLPPDRDEWLAVRDRLRRAARFLTAMSLQYNHEDVAMKTRVWKWGNSLALRIPKSLAAEAGLAEDTAVELSLVEGKLILQPLAQPAPMLDDLLRGVTDENLHGEWDTGPAVGRKG